jgi:Protein of unknown function (DUF3025)
MNISHSWNPAALIQVPLFLPLHPILAHLDTANFPTISDLNAQLVTKPINVKLGPSLQFVPQESGPLRFESQYEPRCYLTGEVQTRTHNWHDLLNALVWLTFPKAKAAINKRHFMALNSASEPEGSQRGKVRDMATLLDESGVIVFSANPELADKLMAFQWKDLFWQHRSQTESAMGFFIFGHGLYEKCLQPYLGMTGQGLLLNVSAEFFDWPLSDQLNFLDERIAEYVDNPAHCQSTRELHPVPLLGVPGWSAENNSEEYYDNANYFRAGRRGVK